MAEDTTTKLMTEQLKVANETHTTAKQTLGTVKALAGQSKGIEGSVQALEGQNKNVEKKGTETNRLLSRQIDDNKTMQDIARENAYELKNALGELKDGFSFFSKNLKDLGIGGGDVLGKLVEKLQAAINLLLSPIAMLTGFIIGIGKGLGAATRAAKDGSKFTKLFSLPLLAFNKAIQSITKLLGTRTAFLTKAGGPIWNIKQLFNTLTAGFKFDSINKNATKFQKSVFNIGQQFRKVVKSFGKAGELFSKLAAPFKGLVKGVAAIGKVVGRLFAPLNFIFVAFETVRESLNGFKEAGIVGGILGAISGFIKGLITIPLDLIINAVGWIAGKLGFENVATALKEFSFTELLTTFTDKLYDIINGIREWVGTKFENVKESLMNFDPFEALGNIGDKISTALSDAGAWVGEKVRGLLAKLNPLNWFKGDDAEGDYAGEFAEGGNIPAGKFGLVGERGPEFVGGPSSVMSADKSRSMMQTATKLMGGTGDDVDIKGQVLFTRETGEQALESFNAALESAGIQEKITLDELKQAQMDGIENTSNRVGDLYDQFLRKTETAALDISDAFDIDLDDLGMGSSSGETIKAAETEIADARMSNQSGGGSAIANSGNVTSSIVTSTNTIMAGVNTRNNDSISFLNKNI